MPSALKEGFQPDPNSVTVELLEQRYAVTQRLLSSQILSQAPLLVHTGKVGLPSTSMSLLNLQRHLQLSLAKPPSQQLCQLDLAC